ncbi:MAG: monofunctional biosynthetic peptidoglycan transglycosylase [Elusimicrobiota bacterium]|jgi:monofunctional biosynthetic peptidoglycan transglycosylase
MSPRRTRKSGRLSWIGAALFLLWLAFSFSSLPEVRYLKRENPKTTAFIERYREKERAKGRRPAVPMRWTPLSEMSPNLVHAVVIAEDDMFYQHKGVDWESVREAARYNWEKKRLRRGASTITQQLARNLYLSPSRNPLRKLKEFLIARRLEENLSKRRILELYMNVAEWGPGIYGAPEACRVYYGKSPADITPDEAVALAAALPSPKRWNPGRPAGPKLLKRREVLLNRMRAAGWLPSSTTDYALPIEDQETYSPPSL